MGIPFDFAAQPVVAKPKPPKPTTQVRALKERAALEITFPRVEGYRVALPDERIDARLHRPTSRLVLTPEKVGPCRVLLEGIVGEGVELTTAVLEAVRPSEISYHLAKHLLYNQFRDPRRAAEDAPVRADQARGEALARRGISGLSSAARRRPW